MTDTVTMSTPLSLVGIEVCRACAAGRLESVLNLGAQPLANELLVSAESPETYFPLHLRICTSCGLGQVGEFVPREHIFSDYPYLSSVSSSWVAHARSYATSMAEQLGLAARNALVVEVASNDGYLLREFVALGVRVLGVEPAANVAEVARLAGVETLTSFFGRATARSIVREHGHPRLVVANNVMAHVPDLSDFVSGLAELCDDQTLITVENPSFVTLLNETQFDTIYHEHFSYLSAHAVDRLVARHGLELVGVDNLTTHGGSYRYTIARAGTRVAAGSVAATIDRELREGLLSGDAWIAFQQRSAQAINGLRAWLDERVQLGEHVAAYGAAAKGNTLLNAAIVKAFDIVAVADGSVEKQGKYLPGSHIPVVTPSALADIDASHILILPWNIADELAPLVRALRPDAQLWIAVPAMHVLTT